ncbi:CpaF family protein, partial [Halomonas marinisediminis]
MFFKRKNVSQNLQDVQPSQEPEVLSQVEIKKTENLSPMDAKLKIIAEQAKQLEQEQE